MREFIIKLRIKAKSETEMKGIANALLTLYNKVPTEDLIIIADHVKKDPTVISKVRKLADNKLVQGLFKKG